MATLICNGCFDLLHEGHRQFLNAARTIGCNPLDPGTMAHHLIVAVNSDESAKKLKGRKWGDNYPRDSQHLRAQKLREYADQVVIFDTETELHDIIEFAAPCIIVKGPDYAGRETLVTGYDIAPILILDTPETEEIRELKRSAYLL